MAATVDHAAYADQVADLVAGDGGAGAGDAADDLMAGHAGIDGVAPLVFDLVQVGVADAAEQDADFDLVGAGFGAVVLEGAEAAVGALGGVA